MTSGMLEREDGVGTERSLLPSRMFESRTNGYFRFTKIPVTTYKLSLEKVNQYFLRHCRFAWSGVSS